MSAMVGLWLDAETAAALAIDGGEPAAALHLTLCLLETDAANLTDVQVARLLTTVDDLAAFTPPLEGSIAGMGRFYASDSSDGQDVVFAIPDLPKLSDVRQRLCDNLGYAGLACKQTHGHVPHVTLAYVAPGAASPVDAVPTLPLRFAALTVVVGDRMTSIPLRGWYDGPMVYADAAVLGEGHRFFTELQSYIEPPAWLPLLPTPGSYVHPSYGGVELPADRIARLVASINNGVYQPAIPIDISHNQDDLELNGALGWFGEARVNADGSADVKVEWTPRGEAALREDRFRYVSPEFILQWQNATGETFDDVVLGLALCPNPFFKDLAIDRAVVASERGAAVPTLSLVSRYPETGEPLRFVARDKQAHGAPEDHEMTDKAPTAQQFADLDQKLSTLSQSFTDLQGKHADLQQKFTESETARVAAETAAETYKADVDALKAERTIQQFTAEIRGDGPTSTSKPAFLGDEAKHLRILQAFSDDELRADYIATQREQARRFISAAIKPVMGSDAPGESGGGADKLTALARSRATEKGITFSEAMTQIEKEQPQLFAEYQAAPTSAIRIRPE